MFRLLPKEEKYFEMFNRVASHMTECALLLQKIFSDSPCLAPFPLMYGPAEPVLETRRADARVIAGGEALIVQLFAEVARMALWCPLG